VLYPLFGENEWNGHFGEVKMNKRIWVLPAIILAASGPLFSKVSLQQAVEQAWAQSPAVERQLLSQEAARIGRSYAMRQRLFRIDAGGSYRFSSDAVQVMAKDFPILPPDLGIPENMLLLSAPHDFYDLRMTLVQPLYTGGAINQAIRMEEIKGLLEQKRTELVKNDLAGQVKFSFLTYRLLLAKRDSLGRLLENLGLHLEKIEAFVREQLARRSDLLETRNRIDEVRINLEDIGLQVEQERIAFQTLCGLDPEEVDPAGLEAAGTIEDSLAAFSQGHPLLAAFEDQGLLVEAGRKAAAAARLPQLAGTYELHYGKPGVNFFKKDWALYVQAGLTLTVPLINRSQSDRDLALSEVEKRKLASQREDFIRETEKGLKQVYEIKRSLQAKQTLAGGLVRDAEEDVKLKESLYRESQISNLDYLAAVADLEKYRSLKAELDIEQSLADVRIQTLIGRQGAGR
jgi:outer membrane protein TolC